MIRLGHVTNSSSSNHIIAWNGKLNDLIDILQEHETVFPTSYYSHGTSHNYVTNTDEIINHIIQHIHGSHYKEDKDRMEKVNDEINSFRDISNKLDIIKDKDWILIVPFSDEDYDDMGKVMRWGGQHIYVEKDNFIYMLGSG